MKVLIQRVKQASVDVNNECVGKIDKGLLVFLGVKEEDTEDNVDYLVNKIINLRIFSDDNDKMNLSLLDTNGQVLVVSQFTLYADCSRGRRPSYTNAANPKLAKKLYESFIEKLKREDIKVQSGIFGAYMDVNLINDGPVTIMIEN
jgi:D-tyrosyl-tRNA(Tyr) deacylase